MMVYSGGEKRSEPRRTYYASVQYALAGAEERILKGTVINISLSGMGMFCYNPLSEGQEIIVRNISPRSHFCYQVQWSQKLGEDFFLVGLKMKE
ncbi:MAG: PilZ domain-containing protein [Nitrospirae bacterium]|nr:PilZ domain-containing protein [Nitrospirota bacterium]